MLTNSRVTVYRSRNCGKYERIGTYPAWSYLQSRERRESGGAYNRDVFDVRIPKCENLTVKVGDLIAFGDCKATVAELSQCRTVYAVTENYFGVCPHLHIEAENQYR